jgi:ankyrin repeat protein
MLGDPFPSAELQPCFPIHSPGTIASLLLMMMSPTPACSPTTSFVVGVVRSLLDNPMGEAIAERDMDKLRHSLEASGAEVLMQAGKEGFTALCLAIAAKWPQAVQLLLAAGSPEEQLLARVTAPGCAGGLIPLMLACVIDDADSARLLLAHCPQEQLLTRGVDGYTPLMVAIEHGSAGCVQALLEAGSLEEQLTATNEEGLTALAIASGYEPLCVQPLLEACQRRFREAPSPVLARCLEEIREVGCGEVPEDIS